MCNGIVINFRLPDDHGVYTTEKTQQFMLTKEDLFELFDKFHKLKYEWMHSRLPLSTVIEMPLEST